MILESLYLRVNPLKVYTHRIFLLKTFPPVHSPSFGLAFTENSQETGFKKKGSVKRYWVYFQFTSEPLLCLSSNIFPLFSSKWMVFDGLRVSTDVGKTLLLNLKASHRMWWRRLVVFSWKATCVSLLQVFVYCISCCRACILCCTCGICKMYCVCMAATLAMFRFVRKSQLNGASWLNKSM